MDKIKVCLSRGLPSPPSCMPVNMAEDALISLNIPKYPWKWLNKLSWLSQGSEYAWSSYIFDKFLEDALGSK